MDSQTQRNLQLFVILPNIIPGRLMEKRKVTEGQVILAWLLKPSVVLATMGCYILLLRQTSRSGTLICFLEAIHFPAVLFETLIYP